MAMMLLVGLGNPGPQYARNRHNIGFMAVDEIVRRHGFSPWRKRFQGQSCEGSVGGEKVLALEPQTYMNLSGQSVGEAMRFFKLTPSDVVVFHDELDLPPGRLRVKRGGGHGGHNGLRSLDEHIGKDYWRIRIGIGHPGHKDAVSGYVLHDFHKAELTWVEPLVDALAADFPILAKGEHERYLQRVNAIVNPPPPKRERPPKPPPGAGARAGEPAPKPGTGGEGA
jgi:PTH1 family peptidyl-tRNA hydrolase